MTISEELLMAYADNELASPERERVEAVLRDDPVLQRRVAQHRALRATLERAYAPELTEPVPVRLVTAIRDAPQPSTASIAPIEAARRRASAQRQNEETVWRRPGRRPLLSIAAGLLVAVGAGLFLWHRAASVWIQDDHGTRVARGALAQGLSDQLAGDRPPGSGVSIGLSFVAKSGDYCRTFTLSQVSSGAGLACRHAARWEIRELIPSDATNAGEGDYRTAGTSLPPDLRALVEQQIVGDPLDRNAERAAQQRGWQIKRNP
jgi:hypothetical protein